MSDILCPLAEAAKRYGAEPAFIAANRVITYEEYDRLVSAAASNFHNGGVKAGERVAVVAENCLQYVIILIALFRLKAVACLISPRFPEKAISNYLKRIKCDRLISLSDTLRYDDSLPIRKLAVADVVALAEVSKSRTKDPSISLEQDATIIQTSGTTAQPKAVLHTYGNHNFNALGSNKNIEVKPGDRWLLSLPLYHVGGLAILFRAMLGGGAVVIPNDGEDILDAIQRHKVTHLSLVSTQLYRLLKTPSFNQLACQLKAVLVGGSAVPKTLIRKAYESGLPLFTTYGLTEMASQVTATQPADSLDRVLTSGKPLVYRQIKISPQGEIVVKGETLFGGYVNKTNVALPVDNKGWFHTGDLGNIDTTGYLTVKGRKDNMFISGGENIYPEEIEGTLSLLDGISETVVVPVEDDEFGFRPVAVVRSSDNKNLCKDDLVAGLEQFLPRFKIPVRFYRWPDSDEKDLLKPSRHHFQELVKTEQLMEIT
jgi:O-succinylbenzoic acid--CoA ligase